MKKNENIWEIAEDFGKKYFGQIDNIKELENRYDFLIACLTVQKRKRLMELVKKNQYTLEEYSILKENGLVG